MAERQNGDGGWPPSPQEVKLVDLLERYAAIELNLSATDRGAGDVGSLTRPNGIVSRLAETRMIPEKRLHTSCAASVPILCLRQPRRIKNSAMSQRPDD
jgi:hypothetical protein